MMCVNNAALSLSGVVASLRLITYNRIQLSTIANAIRTTKSNRRLVKLPTGKFAAISLTPSAVKRVSELLSSQPDALGLRVGVRTRGCTGLSYTLAFCTEGEQPGDEVVEQDGVRVFIDRRAQLTLLGTEMDFQTNLLSSEFVFNNPNVTGTCGCGESFSI